MVLVADSGNNRVLGFSGPFTSGQLSTATFVIGQPNLNTATSGRGLSSLNAPLGVTLDFAGNLWVVDTGNNRLVEFIAPFINGKSATFTLGQSGCGNPSSTTLCNPSSAAFDTQGNLWIADTDDNRILEFAPPFTNGVTKNPVLVIGQSQAACSGQPTANNLCHPHGLAFDLHGNLWVADTGYNRVVEYIPPFTNGANLVLGQPNCNSSAYNGGQSMPLPDSLAAPSAVVGDVFGNLWVSDTQNGRVIEFPIQALSSGNTSGCAKGGAATVAIGQPDLYSGNINSPSPCQDAPNTTATNVCLPEGIFFDIGDNLWVADTQNNRVVRYTPSPASNGSVAFTNNVPNAANLVLGQSGFTTTGSGNGATGLNQPTAVYVNIPNL
jgi:sugar lactone lactonase YvrE